MGEKNKNGVKNKTQIQKKRTSARLENKKSKLVVLTEKENEENMVEDNNNFRTAKKPISKLDNELLDVLKICKQSKIRSMKNFTKNYSKLKKLGEGVFAEVFQGNNEKVVMKICPFGGKELLSGQVQHKITNIWNE